MVNRLVGEQDIAPVPPCSDSRWLVVTLPLSEFMCEPRTLEQLQVWAKRSSYSRAFLLQMLAWLENRHRVVRRNAEWETSPRLRRLFAGKVGVA